MTPLRAVLFFVIVNTSLLYPNKLKNWNLDVAKEHQQKSLRAILVCDTSSNLYQPIQQDLDLVDNALTTICKNLHITYRPSIIKGEDLCYATIHNTLFLPENAANDIFIFYYTGHGFHDQNQSLPWPSMSLSTTHESIYSPLIYQHLLLYNSNLTIILFDCCNSYIFQKIFAQKFSKELSSANFASLKKLFLQSSGTIIATASLPGSPSYAFSTGSLFTTTLIRHILFSDTPCEIDWKTIFTRVQKDCEHFQTPYVELQNVQ